MWEHAVVHRMRDYSQDLDALLIAKPPRLTVDHLAMYQDYIGKPLHKMTGEKDKLVDSTEVDEAEVAIV